MKKANLFKIILAICIILITCTSCSEVSKTFDDIKNTHEEYVETKETSKENISSENTSNKKTSNKETSNKKNNKNTSKKNNKNTSKKNTFKDYIYCYKTLNSNEKKLYEDIYTALYNPEQKIKISEYDADIIKKIYMNVIADHPEIFWAEKYVINTTTLLDKVTSASITVTASMDEETIKNWQKKIDSYYTEFEKNKNKNGIKDSSSDYEKIKFTFDYIVKNTDYKLNSPNNQNICSVCSGKSVCQGYSMMMQYLLLKQNIPAITISGKSKGEGHAWNLVYSDNNWYNLDVTWGDPSFSEGNKYNIIDYSYFLVNDEISNLTHTPDKYIKLPKCNTMNDNYYVKEKCYYKKWNFDIFSKTISQQLSENSDFFSVRLSNSSEYNKMLNELISNHKIFKLTYKDKYGKRKNIQKISYIQNEKLNIIIFVLSK